MVLKTVFFFYLCCFPIYLNQSQKLSISLALLFSVLLGLVYIPQIPQAVQFVMGNCWKKAIEIVIVFHFFFII